MDLPLLKREEAEATRARVRNSPIHSFLGLSISFFGPNKAGSAAVPLNLFLNIMKKLIVTCTAVVYAIAFVGCGGADPESLPEGENTAGDETSTGDEEGEGADPISGGGEGGGTEE